MRRKRSKRERRLADLAGVSLAETEEGEEKLRGEGSDDDDGE